MPTIEFPYIQTGVALGSAALMPYLPVTLLRGNTTTTISALVDSGAALNVLPHAAGLALGLNWNEQRIPVRLAGNLFDSNAWAVIIEAQIGDFQTTRLAFAWSSRNDHPAILGQVNFFLSFDVTFQRSQGVFSVTPVTDPSMPRI